MISFTSKPRISGLVAVIVLLGVPFSTTGGRVLATATPYNVLYEFTGNKNCPNSNDDVTTQPPYATFSPLTMVGVICDKPSDDHRSSSWAQTAFRGTGQYLSFTVSATTGHSLSFAASDVMGFMSSITVNGPTDGEVFCSVDGQAFQSMGFFLTNSLVILPMPKVVKASSVEFRFYAWKAAAANGVLILDNITVAGSTSPVNSTGMAIWRRSGSSAPRYNTWDGSTFGTAANSANVGEWRNLAAAAAPTRDEVIVVGVDAAGDITGQMWDGNAWTPIPFNPLANSSFSDYVLFDVAYESQSGDAVLAWGNGTGGGSSVSYAVWNGAVWLLPADIGISVMGETRHLRLAAHPNNDEMVLVANNDAGAGASFAVVWDGSTWGNAQLLSNPSAGVTDLCVAYEPQRGNAMAVYGKSGFTVNAYYRVWNGANWTSEDSVVVTGGVSFPPQSLKLGSDPASNRIALGASTYGGAGRVWLSIWDGNLWEPTTVIGTVGTEAPVAVGFIGDSGEAMVAHRTNTSTQVAYRTWTSGGGWSGAQSGPELGDDATSLTLSPHPLYDRLMLSAQDAARNMTYVQWDGTSWGTPSQQEVDTGETLTRPFAFVWTPAPPYNPPSVVAAIADTTVDEDSPPLDDYRDLNDVFSDSEDGDSLSFTIQSNSNSGLVIAAIDPSDSTLDLALVPDRRGVATIIIRATDSSAGFVEDTLVVTVVAADMQMATGRHLGNGIAGWPIANVGFQPDVVFIKGDNTDPTVVRTSTMVGDAAKELGPNNALTSNLIMSLDADGFTIGSNQQVNSAGVTYYWVAFKAATGEMVVDTYPGLGGDDRSIPGVGFTPEYVIVMNEGGAVAMQRFSAQVGDNSLPFASSDPRPDRIQALEADGFQVGQHNTVNEGGQTFHYVAWKTVPGRIAGSLHLGTGGDDHDMNGVGFQPDFLIISAQGNVSPTAHRPSSLGGDNTLLVDDVTFNDGVQTFLPDGFQLGQDDAVNRAGEIYFWVAFNSVETLDLALRKTVLDTTANEGDTLSYSVVVANRGPEAATGVVLTDLLPAGVSYLANSASQGPYTDSTGVWSVGGIANGDSATLTLTATVDSGTGGSIITNTAAITAVDQLDSLSANDTDTATVTVQSVDLETVKSVDITTPDEGDTISYTVIVSNNGPDDAAMLQLSDTLPTAVTYISHSASNGNYNFASGQWNINSLPNGDADTLTITASIDVETAGTTIMNTVAIDFAEQADPNPTNDIDSVAVVVASADVALTKTVSPVVTNEGDTITYMITVSNSGPQSAPSVAVADTLPTGVTYVTSTSSQGSYDVGTGVWTVGSVDSATSDTLAVTAIINAGVAGSTISNWAAITTTGRGDPDGSNDADTVSIDVTSADLAVAKTVDTGAPAEGDTVAYTIMVSNAGPDTATGIEITDSLPVGLTYVSQMTTQGNYDSTTGVWAIANVANAASDTLILIVAVDAGTGGSTINNTAAVTQADVGDPDASNNSDTAGINVNDGPVVASAIPDTTVSEDSAPVGNYRDLNDVFTDVEDGR
ncbi:MAG: DUF11 domain-containing protein, partial [Candidatus Krumholzibacteria bacterium]|nr:DUF11 domain-containing protein [Candidatus Krumholzibacteria bacterium]